MYGNWLHEARLPKSGKQSWVNHDDVPEAEEGIFSLVKSGK